MWNIIDAFGDSDGNCGKHALNSNGEDILVESGDEFNFELTKLFRTPCRPPTKSPTRAPTNTSKMSKSSKEEKSLKSEK